jgi:hypothetical protein
MNNAGVLERLKSNTYTHRTAAPRPCDDLIIQGDTHPCVTRPHPQQTHIIPARLNCSRRSLMSHASLVSHAMLVLMLMLMPAFLPLAAVD